MRQLVVIISLLSLAACGFTPVYSERYNTRTELTQIDVIAPPGRNGALLEAELEDYFNPEHRPAEKRYLLEVKLAVNYIPIAIERDGTVARYSIELKSPFVLRRLSDNQVIYKDTVRRISSFNVSEQEDFATYVARSDASERGVKALAEDFRLRLSGFFSQSRAE
ncbi:MAG: hypothetical protein CMM94_08775 [Rickettsiales bacterium]|nr:hypothetical protein [Rickettsiales bacterium]